MSQIGMSQAELDAIELRLIGCDHRPWSVSSSYDTNGRKYVMKGSNKSHRRAFEDASVYSARPDVAELAALDGDGKQTHGAYTKVDERRLFSGLCLFTPGVDTSDDMLSFVASAPADMEKLLNEVKFLRKRYRDCEKERDDFRKEVLSMRVEKTTLQEKLTDTRRALKSFGELLKEVSR